MIVGAICTVLIPPLSAAPQGGTRTGHVQVRCVRPWERSTNQIEYKDRWRILGTHTHPGAKAGVLVTQGVDIDRGYHGDGYWREVVVVKGDGWSERHVGPVSWLRT